jgi:hypothetical protein
MRKNFPTLLNTNSVQNVFERRRVLVHRFLPQHRSPDLKSRIGSDEHHVVLKAKLFALFVGQNNPTLFISGDMLCSGRKLTNESAPIRRLQAVVFFNPLDLAPEF